MTKTLKVALWMVKEAISEADLLSLDRDMDQWEEELDSVEFLFLSKQFIRKLNELRGEC